jgi:hypothetical protein
MGSPTETTTARALIQFLDRASKQGLLVRRTAEAYKTASTKILKIDGEAWEETDLRTLDLDSQIDRFVRLEGSAFKPETLRTYESRFRSAVAELLKYEEDPRSYRGPAAQRRTGPRKANTPVERRQEVGASQTVGGGTDSKVAEVRQADGGGASRSSLVKYPFPLRSGELAYFELPRDLTRAEARRMTAFISSLAIDSMPELTSGRDEET